jgi:hypothetical protein
MSYRQPAPAIRRMIVSEAGAALGAKTQRDRQASFAALYAYGTCLRLLLANDAGQEPGIEAPPGTYDDPRWLAEAVRFFGDVTARELGLA